MGESPADAAILQRYALARSRVTGCVLQMGATGPERGGAGQGH